MQFVKTAVVILNWNTADYLRRFIPPLLKSCAGLDAQVIVVDSASTDASPDVLREEFPGVRTILLEENFGFTGGYNRALAGIDAEYFVLLNSDVEVPETWLTPLVGWLDAHPDCAVAGPVFHALLPEGRSDSFEYAGAAGGLLDRYGYPFCRGRVPGRMAVDEGQYGTPKDVMWVSGACLVTRACVWKKLGGFDGRFFAHMEEIDYCWRAQLAGWKVTVVPESVVYHIGGGTLPQTSRFKLKLNYRNNLLLLDANLAATIGYGAACRRIFIRKILDGGAALVYLLSGRVDCFRAVLDAHREYRELRRQAAGLRDDRTEARVHGILPVRILLQTALRGEKIFNYLTRYEDSY